MTLPSGFSVTLFAGEPDIVQPIATAFDDRGRLWVAECLSYPKWVSDPKQGHDRIVIFEDANGDGHFSKKIVFTDNIQNISGLEVGMGGVWVCASPNLLFIPIDASGDKPAGPAKVILDGWDIKTAEHNVFNRVVFGPDGWLYGCNGIQSKSLVGKPGAPDTQRTAMNCGVWRYHPVRGVFEVVANGTTNPWGLDFDDYGQMFITNCVIEHIFHVIPGAHFKRMYGEDFDKHAYALMQSCADHIHWAGGAWQNSRGGEAHGQAGGGHAHAGCMVYLGDNWPDAYRNGVFMCNIHGNRVNHDLLEQKGSGYVAHHGADFLMANDPWFRGLNLVYGPDGGVYVQDWTDTGECHNHVVVDRSNGRIYKIVYGKMPKPVKVDIGKLSDAELVQLQAHHNDWYVRRARLQLAQRAAEGKLGDRAGVTAALTKMFKEEASVPRRLRALWALYVIGDKAAVRAAVADAEPQVEAWRMRLLVDGDLPPDNAAEALTEASKSESPVVRLAVASALRRIPAEERIPALHVLAGRADDSGDANLPLMIWYAAAPVIEPAAETDFEQFVPATRIPLLREFSARMLAERGADDGVELLKAMVERSAAEPACAEAVLDVMRGVRAALKDARLSTPPEGWGQVAAKLAKDERAEVRRGALVLSLAFGDASAQAPARAFVSDATNLPDARREVFGAIIQSLPADLAALLRGMLSDPVLGEMAIRGLASANDPQTPTVLLERYAGMSHEAKRDVLATLASRPTWAMALLKAVQEGKVPQADVGALTVRQLTTLKDKAVDGEVAKLWGKVRAASADKVELMTQYRQELAPDALKKADLVNGRVVFNKTCAQCHALFDSGGKLGPDLTGSQRANLDYVLENVLDPSAVVAREYLMTVVHMSDDRVLTGIAAEETADTLLLKMPTENATLRKSEIKSRKTESISMMPEGLLQGLTAAERRDLVAYLASDKQVALPAAAK